MLEKLKVLLGVSADDLSKNELLLALLEKSTALALNYTRRTELPPQLEPVVIDHAVIAYNRMGAEGEQGRSEGDVNYTFYGSGDDIPKSIQKQLDRYTLPPKARVIGT